MRQTKCDNCETITTNPSNWLRLNRPYDLPAPKGYVMGPGREEFDFCTPDCAAAFLEKEVADGS